MVRRYAQTGYSKTQSKVRNVYLPPEVDKALELIATEASTTVSALLNDAAVMYVEKMTFRGEVGLASASFTASVGNSLDQYPQRLAGIRDTYADAAEKLAGKPPKEI